MDDTQIEEGVMELLEEVCGDEVVREERDLDLFEEGLLDSMAAIEVLVGIEERFGVEIGTTQYKREEMNTPAKIVERVKENM